MQFFLAAIPMIQQMITSQRQRKEISQLTKSGLQPATRESLAVSRGLANQTVSPEYNRGVQAMEKATANTITGAKSLLKNPADIQAVVGEADARTKEGIKDLNVKNQLFKLDNTRFYSNTLDKVGAQQQHNEDALNAAKSALTGASMQNSYNATTGLASTGILAAGQAERENSKVSPSTTTKPDSKESVPGSDAAAMDHDPKKKMNSYIDEVLSSFGMSYANVNR